MVAVGRDRIARFQPVGLCRGMRYASDDEVPDCVSEDDASESEDEWDSENEDLAPETMAAVTALEALAWCVLQTHVPPDAAQGLVKERRGRPKAADDGLVQARRNHVGATPMASRASSDFEAAKLATHLQAAAPSRPKRAVCLLALHQGHQ